MYRELMQEPIKSNEYKIQKPFENRKMNSLNCTLHLKCNVNPISFYVFNVIIEFCFLCSLVIKNLIFETHFEFFKFAVIS